MGVLIIREVPEFRKPQISATLRHVEEVSLLLNGSCLESRRV